MKNRRSLWLTVATLGVLWGALCRHLAAHWNSNPQYSFGWLVPAAALYLAHRRWTTRPAPAEPAGSGLRWLVALLAFALFPTWLIEQPNPDWRLVSWLFAVEI